MIDGVETSAEYDRSVRRHVISFEIAAREHQKPTASLHSERRVVLSKYWLRVAGACVL